MVHASLVEATAQLHSQTDLAGALARDVMELQERLSAALGRIGGLERQRDEALQARDLAREASNRDLEEQRQAVAELRGARAAIAAREIAVQCASDAVRQLLGQRRDNERSEIVRLRAIADAARAVDAEVSCADVRMDAPPSFFLPRRERSRDALLRLRAALAGSVCPADCACKICPRCGERPGGAEETIWCAECLAELQAEAMRDADRLAGDGGKA